jgi:thymidylate synthase (FAD)
MELSELSNSFNNADVRFRSDMTVKLIDSMGDDARICQAARVSTKGTESFGTGEAEGLINYLARDRHGSPFEHVLFTWLIEAPIFVWREFMRHRMASYNEESGRYKQLAPVFYVPSPERKLVQVGKAAAYHLEPGTPVQQGEVEWHLEIAARECYDSYERLLSEGIAREVARMVLPVSIFSSAYVTMNLRAAFNFLSLRNSAGDAEKAFPTHPQREIEMVAEKMEEHVKQIAPLAHAAFVKNGRVAP